MVLKFRGWVEEVDSGVDDSFDGSDYTYEEVGIDEEFESEGDVESEDLEATLHSLQKLSFLLGKSVQTRNLTESLQLLFSPPSQVQVYVPAWWCFPGHSFWSKFGGHRGAGKGQKSVAVPEVRRQREVLDDFVRNFCMTYNLHKTLEVFEVRANRNPYSLLVQELNLAVYCGSRPNLNLLR